MDIRQQKNKTVSTDEWYTPQWIIETLGLSILTLALQRSDLLIRQRCIGQKNRTG